MKCPWSQSFAVEEEAEADRGFCRRRREGNRGSKPNPAARHIGDPGAVEHMKLSSTTHLYFSALPVFLLF